MHHNLSQKVLVTAGGSGIGLAIAQEFMAAGADVFVCDVSEVALNKALTEHPKLKGCIADVGDPIAVESLFKSILDSFGTLNVLVNNAGIGGPRALVEDIEYADWDDTIRINLSGMFYCIKQAIPLMKKQNGGSIINISTASVKVGLPGRLPYVTSKMGVHGLSHTLAREVGPFNIRCNCILPGFMDNPRGVALMENAAREQGRTVKEVEDEFLQLISMRTKIQPTEIGQMAVFLASDKAKHITAQEISVDGNVEWEG